MAADVNGTDDIGALNSSDDEKSSPLIFFFSLTYVPSSTASVLVESPRCPPPASLELKEKGNSVRISRQHALTLTSSYANDSSNSTTKN